MTCGNDLINSQLVTPLAREAEQCAHTGNLNQTPSQTNSSQRKVKLKKHITLMIRYKLKVLTLHSLSFLSFLGPILSIKWQSTVDSYCDSWVKLKIILGWLFWKTEQMHKIYISTGLDFDWKKVYFFWECSQEVTRHLLTRDPIQDGWIKELIKQKWKFWAVLGNRGCREKTTPNCQVSMQLFGVVF